MIISRYACPVFDELTGSAYVLQLKTGKWHFFNPVAGKVLKQLIAGEDLSTCLKNVAAGFKTPVPVEIVRADMEPVIRSMIQFGIIEEDACDC